MQKIGAILLSLGLLAVVLDFFNYVPRVLLWIYNWGDTIAWSIKIGLILCGALLYLAGDKKHRMNS